MGDVTLAWWWPKTPSSLLWVATAIATLLTKTLPVLPRMLHLSLLILQIIFCGRNQISPGRLSHWSPQVHQAKPSRISRCHSIQSLVPLLDTELSLYGSHNVPRFWLWSFIYKKLVSLEAQNPFFPSSKYKDEPYLNCFHRVFPSLCFNCFHSVTLPQFSWSVSFLVWLCPF